MHAGVEGAAPQSSLPTNEEGDKESVSMCDGGGTMIFERKVELPEPIKRYVTGAVSQQQAMNALEMEEWREIRKKKCKVARPNDKLVVGARVIYKRQILSRTERSRSTDVNLAL